MSYSIVLIENLESVSSKELKILDKLIDIAENSDAPDYRMAACLKVNPSLFFGYNQYCRTRTKKMNTYSLHAEMHAISLYIREVGGLDSNFRSLKKNKIPINNKSTIYITRPLKTSRNLPTTQHLWFGCSKPCENCRNRLMEAGIGKIKYTDIINGKQVLCTMKLDK